MNRGLTAAGLLVLLASWLGPLPDLARTSFLAHMTMHVAVVAVGAPLIGIGIAQARVLHGQAARVLAPIPASLFEFVVVWGWHAPALHAAARTHPGALIAEQASFFAAGLLLWVSAFRRSPEGAGGGVLALLLTSMHMIFLGTLMTLSPRPLYHLHASASAERLADQQLGGILMLAGGGLPYLVGGLLLTWRLLQPVLAGDSRGVSR